jgi:flagellar biosynthetic protein FliQ
MEALVFEALQLALWLSAPALVACVLAAAAIGLFQAATQVSEPSLGFVPKLCAVLAALWVSRAFMSEQLLRFTGHVLREMARLGA